MVVHHGGVEMTTRMGDKPNAFITAVILLVYISTSESCKPCPPGKFMKRPCTEGFWNTTVCEACPRGTFMDTPNTLAGCFLHRQCHVGSHETIVSPGTATHDTVCQCEEGYHREVVDCERNPYCPLGEGVIPTGDGCEKCSNGTYSDKISNIEACVRWINCGKYGENIISEGTPERNTICTGHIGAGGESTPIAGTDRTTTRFEHIQKGTEANRQLTLSVPKTWTSGTTVAAVGTAFSILTFVGISVLVAYKCRKDLGRKRRHAEGTQISEHTNEEGISDDDDTLVKDTEVHAAVECEEDSLPTHPKLKEAFSPVDDSGDRQHLLNTSSQVDFVPSEERLASTESSHIVSASNPIQDDEMLADEVFHPSDAVDIPEATPGNDESFSVASTSASSRLTSDSSLADREEGRNLVLGVYSDVLTNRVMDQLASELGDNWKDLAPLLDVKQYQVDQILNEHKGDIREQIFAMLRNWQQGKTGEATLSDLYEPLLECNRGEVFSRLQALKDPIT